MHDAPVVGATKTQKTWNGKSARTNAEWTLHCGDALDTLAHFQAERYACVVTSPPYFWQRDYGVVRQLGLEKTIDGYVESLCGVMGEVRRVLKSDGLLFLNLGDTYYSGKGQPHGNDPKHSARRMNSLRLVDQCGLGPQKKTMLGMPWRVALEMIERDWVLRSTIIWTRENLIPESSAKDRPWRSFEYVFMFAKARHYRFSRKELKKAGEEDVWMIESRPSPGREHPAVFPEQLVSRCLAIGNPSRGRVLDPFAGTCTTLRVALDSKMSADGIELNPNYCREAVKQLTDI